MTKARAKQKRDRDRRRRKNRTLHAQQAPTGIRIYSMAEIECEGQEKIPTFNMSPAYNGGELKLQGFPYPVVVELKTAYFEKNSIIANRNHDPKRPVGHTLPDQMSIVSMPGPEMGIHLGGFLSVPGEDTEQIVEAAENKFPWEASIEARFDVQPPIPHGRTVRVNGKTFRGPIFVARNAELYGVAILARGADRNTKVKIAAELISSGELDMPLAQELQDLFESKGLDPQTATRAELAAALKDEFTPPVVDPTKPGNGDLATIVAEWKSEFDSLLRDSRQTAADDASRIQNIAHICAGFDGEIPTVTIGEGDDAKEVSLQAHAISEGWDADKVELKAELWNLRRKSGGATAPHQPEFEPKEMKTRQAVIEASLAINHFGVRPEFMEKELGGGEEAQKILNEAMGRSNREISLHSLMNQVIHAAGLSYSGNFKSMSFWQKMHEAQEKLDIMASGTSTLSLPNAMENVMNKSLLDSFEINQGNWEEIAHIGSVNDFRQVSRVRLTADGGFRRVAKDGQIKHVGLQDAKRTNQAEMFGAILSLTRVDIINDDLGALTDKVSMLGEMAGIRLNEEVWVQFLALAGSLFTVGNKNRLTGAPSAMGPAAYEAARQLFVNQVNANNKPIMTGPSVVVHGVPNGKMARHLYTSDKFDLAQGAADARTPQNMDNEFVGRYRPIESVYMSNTDITDSEGEAIANQTQTGWALLAAPRASLHVVEVVFLNGVRAPQTDTADMVFDKAGIQMKATHDFGVGEGDKEAGVWADGA